MTHPSSHFAIVTRDELWSLDRRSISESRLIYGVADQSDSAIQARDDCDRELFDRCEEETDRVRFALEALREGRARAVVSAQRDDDRIIVTSTISISILDLSVATTRTHLMSDYEILLDLSTVRPETAIDYHELPVAWRNGSAAVLFHEAVGHAAEHAHVSVEWPPWLTATDESDTGTADLLAGEMPRALRRESFTDVPLKRMTNVVVGNRGSDTELPERRIDILLVAGGRYDPMTATATLSIAAADLIDGDSSQRLRPFAMTEERSVIARSLRGACGPLRRYPGVICSKEGQELFVSSYAPDLVTEF